MKQGDEPAFPGSHFHSGENWIDGGMTLRDYFAAKAMQGFCANPAIFAPNAMCGWDLVNCTDNQLATRAGRLADAMLAERAKEQA